MQEPQTDNRRDRLYSEAVSQFGVALQRLAGGHEMDPERRRLVGYGLAFVVSVWSFLVLRKRGRIELKGVDRELVSFFDYAITAHQRQLDMGVSSLAWRSVVLRPSIQESLIGLYVVVRLTSEDWTLAAFLIAVIAVSQWLGFRGRRVLRKEIENLKTLRDRIASTQ